MYYFAYGSNMSLARLRERVPSAVSLGCYILREHDLRFHKSGNDDSAKCDAYFTADPEHTIYGVLFEIDLRQKRVLDRVEGLGYGYEEKEVLVVAGQDCFAKAFTYFATNIDVALNPYSWYVNHVVVGANEAALPADYIQKKIVAVQAIEDKDRARDARQRAIHA